jgi:hypothetical protein
MRTNVLWPAGALALAGEAVVHIQQYFALFHEVRWIGPLFLANAVACAAAIAGLAYRRTRGIAALAGVAISAVALASLIVSYGEGLFGWQEAGFRPIVELTVIFEFAAVVLLSAALAAVITPTARAVTAARAPNPVREVRARSRSHGGS